MSTYGSPGLDIGYSMINVTDEETRNEHREELIFIYHQEFKKILTKLKYPGKIPTMIELQIETIRKGFVEVFTGLAFMPFQYIDFAKVDVQSLLDASSAVGKETRNTAFQQPKVKELLKKYFLQFIRKGFL